MLSLLPLAMLIFDALIRFTLISLVYDAVVCRLYATLPPYRFIISPTPAAAADCLRYADFATMPFHTI